MMIPRHRRGSVRTRHIYRMVQLGRRDGFECGYCHTPLVAPGREAVLCEITPDGWEPKPPWLMPTIDHVVPTAMGGTDELDNLTLACWPCNYEKGRHHHVDWMARASPEFWTRLHRSLIPSEAHVIPKPFVRESAGQNG